LDRLSELVVTNNRFNKPVDFDVNEFYRHSFGIIGPNDKQPEEVIISFTEHQGKYIKTMPLHHSQEILVDNEKELVVKLFMIISFDFEMELMSMADELKVIKPQSLIESLKSKAKRMLKRYESNTQI
jgi:predicted DNA-binding transcriptional regulator YafY